MIPRPRPSYVGVLCRALFLIGTAIACWAYLPWIMDVFAELTTRTRDVLFALEEWVGPVSFFLMRFISPCTRRIASWKRHGPHMPLFCWLEKWCSSHMCSCCWFTLSCSIWRSCWTIVASRSCSAGYCFSRRVCMPTHVCCVSIYPMNGQACTCHRRVSACTPPSAFGSYAFVA